MTVRSAVIGIMTLIRLVCSKKAREQFDLVSRELKASTHEVNAQLARLQREHRRERFSLDVVSGSKKGQESDVPSRAQKLDRPGP
jgi:hypothetical protein